jgi:two-component system OmpR family response regulator
MTTRVLLIDDDAKLFELLRELLAQSGFVVSHAPDGPRGLAMLEQGGVDVVLLDGMLPGMDGLDVLKRLRGKPAFARLPVIMLTARGDEADRIVGLEVGADDYVAKPFSPRELLARLRAVLRRADPDAFAERLQVGDVTVDVGAHQVMRAGRAIELTALELDLLVGLMRRAGRAVARDALLQEAGRGDVSVSERTVDVHVSRLRHKLGEPSPIKTIRGAGYVYAKEAV